MSGAILAAASLVGVSAPAGFATAASPVWGIIPGSGPATTSAAHVTTNAGTAPFTYAWTKQLGSADWTITSPSAATTTFSYAFLEDSELAQAVFKCVVTDNAALTTTLYVSANVRSTSTA
jgi:hypothetical protein